MHDPRLLVLMDQRKRAYQLTFGGPETETKKAVLDDLSKFCREKSSTFHPDSHVHALVEGRREVILRIRDYLDLSVEELCAKYGKDGGVTWKDVS
jgi:hypothetical protein